jgi:Condensation domain
MKLDNVEDIYPLSPLQQGMLFHTLCYPETGAYGDQVLWTFRGELDRAAYEWAWQQIIDRHSILRTAFFWEELREPLQVVRRRVKAPLEFKDWRGMSLSARRERLDSLLNEDLRQGFKVSRAPLMRCILIQMEKGLYQFIWSYHHILLDAWSLTTVFKEVHDLYDAYCLRQDLWPSPNRGYCDYIAWLQSQNTDEAGAFWRKELAGLTDPPSLLSDSRTGKHAHQTKNYGQEAFSLSKEATGRLSAFAKQHQLTMSAVVNGAWALLLSHYSGKQDVIFGVVVSGRPPALEGVESMIGLFINTLPLRVRTPSDSELSPWLKQLQARQVEMRRYEYSSLVQIQGWSEVRRGAMLFETLVIFQNIPMSGAMRRRLANVEIENLTRQQIRTGYPLTLMAVPGSELDFHINYDSGSFDSSFIKDVVAQLIKILERLPENAAQLPTS